MIAPRDAWEKLCRDLDIPCEAVFDVIAARYGENHRFYHVLGHVEALLALLHGDFPTLAVDRPAVELALWFHDIVYDPRANDNEEKSAELMSATIGKTLPREIERKVAAFIIATKHKAPVLDPDAQLVVDLDLSTLGAPPHIFDRYGENIRKEYFWIPDEEYRLGRKTALQNFLNQSPLYHHPPVRRRFEAAAKRNLKAALARL